MFGDNLKKIRNERGISQKKLAELLFVSQQAVAKWEANRTTPDPDTINKIAEYLQISNDVLLGRVSSSTGRGIKIPVLGRVAAGVPIEAIEEILDYEEIEPELAATGDFFALQINGDSMEPKFSKGDVVIVRKQSTIESGEIAIVLVNGDEATCKKVIIQNEGVSLVPTNPLYTPTFYTNGDIRRLPVQIIGKVVELRAKF